MKDDLTLNMLYPHTSLPRSISPHWIFNGIIFMERTGCFARSLCIQLLYEHVLSSCGVCSQIFGLLCSPISYPIPAIFNWRLYNGSATTMIEPFERVVIDS